jgi:hypothetical protein
VRSERNQAVRVRQQGRGCPVLLHLELDPAAALPLAVAPQGTPRGGVGVENLALGTEDQDSAGHGYASPHGQRTGTACVRF